MRKKMRDAHPSRSELFDLKHDAGGMIDIEFIVQYLILRHAPDYARLTADIGNIALLRLCGELGLNAQPPIGAASDQILGCRFLLDVLAILMSLQQ